MELDKKETKEFRGIAATLNYMSQDGPDLQFPIKSVTKLMARPTRGSWKVAKKVARYLIGRKNVVWEFAWQDPVSRSYVASDSDWGGSLRRGKARREERG